MLNFTQLFFYVRSVFVFVFKKAVSKKTWTTENAATLLKMKSKIYIGEVVISDEAFKQMNK